MEPLFILSGIVTGGKNRGKGLGFPTANFPADKSTEQGTYISRIEIDNKFYPAVTFVGTVDTFNETDFTAETYILDFDDDIYGKDVNVQILKKLRDNKKFATESDLIEQMKIDEQRTREYFDQYDS